MRKENLLNKCDYVIAMAWIGLNTFGVTQNNSSVFDYIQRKILWCGFKNLVKNSPQTKLTP